ncbi:MAG: hypothetical protein FWF96_05110 [Kiritimatiellaeota bacterium]|nr:hypothetical protein [Kiritimatiellota bacterium]
MNIQVQKIKIGSESAVVVPVKTWKKIMDTLEDMIDVAAYDHAVKNDDGKYFSLEEVEKYLAERAGDRHGEALRVNETPAKYGAKPHSKNKDG